MTKTCSKCNVEKDVTEFGINRAKKDGLQVQCKPCRKATNHDYYVKNPKKEERAAGARRLKAKNREIIYGILSKAACTDCGIADWRVLEFDHVTGDKVDNIAYLVACKTETLLAEIDKCEIRCKNCHSIITSERAGGWRTMPL